MPEAVHVQILATEHWSLLATRNITYGAIFSRTSIFLTVVSAAVVALALVAQATEFGDRFYVFALLVLPVALFIGVATYFRVILYGGVSAPVPKTIGALASPGGMARATRGPCAA